MTIWELDNYELSTEHGREVVGIGPRYVEISFNFKVLHDAEYTENEDGTINFMHDATYNSDGFASTKLNASYRSPETSYDRPQDAAKPQENQDTEYNEAGDGIEMSQDAKGDMQQSDLGGEI